MPPLALRTWSSTNHFYLYVQPLNRRLGNIKLWVITVEAGITPDESHSDTYALQPHSAHPQAFNQCSLGVHLAHAQVLPCPQLSSAKSTWWNGLADCGDLQALTPGALCQTQRKNPLQIHTHKKEEKAEDCFNRECKGHFGAMIDLKIKAKLYWVFLSHFHENANRLLLRTQTWKVCFSRPTMGA